MNLFMTLFTAAMICMPAAASLFLRPRAGASRARRLRLVLWGATLVALAAAYPARALFAPWILFFPLWFCLFMPYLAAARPEATSPYSAASPVRCASLARRDRISPVSASGWLAGWCFWALSAAVVAVECFSSGGPRLFPAVAILLAPLGLILGPWSVRLALGEPEPLDEQGSKRLEQAYARHRRVRCRGLFMLCIGLAALFSVLAVAAAFGIDIGLAGAVCGSLAGIAGAIFGVRMGA